MTIKVGINGYGRIGRNMLRALYESGKNSEIEIVAVNDLGDANTNAHLTRRDTAHGRFPGKIEVDGDHMVVNGDRIRVLAERDPAKLVEALGDDRGRGGGPQRERGENEAEDRPANDEAVPNQLARSNGQGLDCHELGGVDCEEPRLEVGWQNQDETAHPIAWQARLDPGSCGVRTHPDSLGEVPERVGEPFGHG